MQLNEFQKHRANAFTISRVQMNKVLHLENKLKKVIEEVERLQTIIDNSMKNLENNIIEANITADEVIFNGMNNLNHLEAGFINQEEVYNFLSTLINIEEGVLLGDLKANTIKVENDFSPQSINNHSPSDILYNRNDQNTLGDLIIKGNTVFQKGLNVEGTLNKVNINTENILLKSGNQDFTNSISISQVESENVNAKVLNKFDLSNAVLTSDGLSSTFTSINVDNLVLQGNLNNIKMESLIENTLKTSGNQQITASYTFENLFVNSINIGHYLSGINVTHDVILTSGGFFEIDQDVKIIREITAQNLFVKKSLNHIQVKEGSLDVLLKDATNIQMITGNKTFENVELFRHVQLLGKLINDETDQRNPLVILDEELALVEDVEVFGNITIEKSIRANNIRTSDGVYSLKRLQEQGLRLNDTEIPLHLEFSQQITVSGR